MKNHTRFLRLARRLGLGAVFLFTPCNGWFFPPTTPKAVPVMTPATPAPGGWARVC